MNKTKDIIDFILGNTTEFKTSGSVCNLPTESFQVFPKKITREGDSLIVTYYACGEVRDYAIDLNDANEVVYREYNNEVEIYFGESDEDMIIIPL